MYNFTHQILEKALNYESFIDLTERILKADKHLPPYDQSFYRTYTEANHRRRIKILNNTELNKKLYNELTEGIDQWTWVVIDEPWCGDASFIVPLFRSMEIASMGDINLKIYLRDENPEIMEQYLTNNGKSIPILICLDKNLKELGTWGPRPQPLQKLIESWKPENIDLNEKIKRVHRWYQKDNGITLQKEFIDKIRTWKNKQQS